MLTYVNQHLYDNKKHQGTIIYFVRKTINLFLYYIEHQVSNIVLQYYIIIILCASVIQEETEDITHSFNP